MAYQVIYYNALMAVLRLIRSVLHQIMILQRLPFLLMGAFFLVVGRLFYALFGWHRFFVMGMKWTLRVSFWVRGIRLSVHLPTDGSLRDYSGIHVCNNFHMAYWVLFAHLPYDHLIISNDAFFSSKMFRPMLFLLGFFPEEHGLTPDNFKSVESRLDDYLDQSFSFWQPVFVEYRDMHPLPYAVIMALKHERPIYVWTIQSGGSLDLVHWLKPRRVSLRLVNEVAISRRYPLTISAVYQTLNQHFGPPLNEDIRARQQAPGMPPTSTDLARKKIARAKKSAEELEKEGPFQ
tara:strand:- start:3037 stop:3909 length:873 start_codon:yes stop_codon:yes gene_type:complete